MGGNPPRLHITIPLAGLNLSGGVKSLLLLANRLVERGEAVRLLVPDYAAEPPVALDPRVELRVLRTPGRARSASSGTSCGSPGKRPPGRTSCWRTTS